MHLARADRDVDLDDWFVDLEQESSQEIQITMRARRKKKKQKFRNSKENKERKKPLACMRFVVPVFDILYYNTVL